MTSAERMSQPDKCQASGSSTDVNTLEYQASAGTSADKLGNLSSALLTEPKISAAERGQLEPMWLQNLQD